ncbi:hypothetical protein ACIRRA_39760 [Nocardia sp. NPDC101769]|uniref:hypothetical protein n=1 Tax=Nocardia sp. NPDC101769 TaxID=3364333 RepID=UPI0037F90C02
MTSYATPVTTAAGAAEKAVRQRITTLSRSLRQVTSVAHLQKPRFVDYDSIRDAAGAVHGRKKVILMSGGCSIPTCTMCPFTNYNNHGHGANAEGLRTQVATMLARTDTEPDYTTLALYNDGNFFAPREVLVDVQLDIARQVAATGVRRLVVESLPGFLTAATLSPFVEALGDVQLEVGIGVQSAHRLVRETLVNTRITQRQFESALTVLSDLGVLAKIYLMIKPPFLTDAEAVTDVVDSTAYVADLGVGQVTLCPTRLAPNTVAWWLHQHGHYAAPNLWTVVDAVRGAHDKASVRVACINMRGSDFESLYPDSCPACADDIVAGLVAYSISGDLTELPTGCGCRPPLESVALDEQTILARTRSILDLCEGLA